MRLFVTTMACALCLAALAAQSPAGKQATSAKPAAASANPVSDGLRASWNGVKRNIKESADLMPEENYGFKPTSDVRSFGAILAHVAGASYLFCAPVKGEKAPYAEDYFEKNAKTKAEIVKATNDAIAYCDSALAALTDASAAQMVKPPFGNGEVARAKLVVDQIGHDEEHYGNLVTYFRMKGMVPPSSRRGM
jgi:uncharacterized damage-inducible protein DinB